MQGWDGANWVTLASVTGNNLVKRTVTYAAYATWLRDHADRIDLTAMRPDWPRHSARLVQQALYWFRSRSNRAAAADRCSTRTAPCPACVPSVCPFAA